MEKGLSISVNYNNVTGVLTIFRKNLTPLRCRINAAGIARALPEQIDFSDAFSITISYSPERRLKYGNHPKFEVWISEDGKLKRTQIFDIEVDQPPPNQTEYTFNWAGPLSGYIILSD